MVSTTVSSRHQIIEKRINEIDITKALAIILMVVCHGGVNKNIYHFVYLFHMAVFFIASGCGFKSGNSITLNNVITSIYRKVIGLWLPYFVWNAIFVLCNNFFIQINIYTDNKEIYNYLSGPFITTHEYLTRSQVVQKILKGFYFGNETTLGGAFWFLRTLFFISCLYCFMDFFIRKMFKNEKLIIVQTLLSMVLLAIGYWCGIHGYAVKGFARVFSFYCLYHLGYLFKIKVNTLRTLEIWKYILVLLFSLLILIYLNNHGTISLGANQYLNPAYMLAASIAGFCLLFCLAFFISLTRLEKILISLGKKTLPIVLLHFLSFKIVAWSVVKIYKLPAFCIAAHPNLYGEVGGWWILYTLVGLIVPLMIDAIYLRSLTNCKCYNVIKNIV